MANRPDGSRRGRPAIDWEEAFAYYASLPDNERSYRAVADHFRVSVRTVEAHGRKEHWRERLTQIKAEAAESANQRMAAEHAERLAQFALLLDASLTTYAQQLRAGSVRISPSDVARFYKLFVELWEHGDVHRAAHAHDEAVADVEPADPIQRKLDIIRALDEAGAFDRLRNLTRPPSQSDDATSGESDATDDEAEAA